MNNECCVEKKGKSITRIGTVQYCTRCYARTILMHVNDDDARVSIVSENEVWTSAGQIKNFFFFKIGDDRNPGLPLCHNLRVRCIHCSFENHAAQSSILYS
jgi:hypothetical protein